MTDIRSMDCVFVSHCMLAQCVMAEGVVKNFPAMVKPVIQFCMDHDINIMQMPCPETLCGSGGLGRQPRGKKWYEEHGLRETAKSIAVDQISYMLKLVGQGYRILAIIGVDFSPACAVNYLNKGRSVYKSKGIYIEELEKLLKVHELSIPLIGVCQRWQKKLAKDLRGILPKSQEELFHD